MSCSVLFGPTKHERDDLEIPGSGELRFMRQACGEYESCCSHRENRFSGKMKIVKLLGGRWVRPFGVYLITDGKVQSHHPWQHAQIGAAVGLILGVVFPRKLGTNVANWVQLLEKPGFVGKQKISAVKSVGLVGAVGTDLTPYL